MCFDNFTFHATASPPPLLHHSFTPLPLLPVGEFSLVLLLNAALQELVREGWDNACRK